MNMAGFLWLWLISTVVSIGFDFSLVFKLIKYGADEGYKINFDRMQNIANLNYELNKITLGLYFVPFVNVGLSLKRSLEFENNPDTMINKFRIMGIFEDMSDEEIEEYNKKPTSFNAMMISTKNEVKKADLSIDIKYKKYELKELKSLREELISELNKLKSNPNPDETLITEKLNEISSLDEDISEVTEELNDDENKLIKKL